VKKKRIDIGGAMRHSRRMKTKTCKACGQTKPVEQFQRSSWVGSDGQRTRIGKCNACRWDERKASMQTWAAEKQKAEKQRWQKAARRWDAKHPESPRASKSNLHAKRVGASGRITASDVLAVWNEWEGRCWVCGCEATEVDHVRPLNKQAGGTNTADNIRPICRECNQKRSHGWHGMAVAVKEAGLLKQIKHLLNGSGDTLRGVVGSSVGGDK